MSKTKYADSVLKSWSKIVLIDRIRHLENKLAVSKETINKQTKQLENGLPHSKWEICCDGYYPYCKNCGNEPPGRKMTSYCPNCGAKMDGGMKHDKP